jgi:long-chain acyl-CoA synthetase
MGPFKDGVGLLAVEMAVPVVPVWLEGIGRVLPKGSRLPRPAPVTVRFGPPLRFCPGTPYPVATKAIEEAVRSLAPSESTTPFTMRGR